MSNKEIEIRILEINEEQFIDKILSLGGLKVGEFFQKRYVYDFNPVVSNKWIRLRTNGEKTTLAIKEIKDRNVIDGVDELEIVVEDFEKTNFILNKLGYKARNYQENYRKVYLLKNTEISIDSWPLIPTYAEIEGKNNEDVMEVLELLKDSGKETTLDVDSIYKEIYGIDMKQIVELKFGVKRNEGMLEYHQQM